MLQKRLNIAALAVTVVIAFAARFAVVMVHAAVSDQCKQETLVLQSDEFLNMVQNDLYEIYVKDYNDVCDILGAKCSLKFDGDNKTYVAACEDKGGQVFTRIVEVSCGVDPVTINYDLGKVPVCIGASCDPQAIEDDELNETRVQELLSNLRLTGCSTQFSGASNRRRGYSSSTLVGGLMATASFVVGAFLL